MRTTANELSKIPEFTAEDFLNSLTPYEFVYAFHENKFQEARAIQLVAQVALSCKIRNFKSMYDNYLSSLQQLHEETINYTEFENQPFQLLCGDWKADNTGIYLSGVYGMEQACPHPIMPVMRLINIDTGAEKIKLGFQRGGRWREVLVEKNVLATASKIVALSDQGVGVTSENAKLLVRYLADVEHLNYDTIPETYSFSRLGFIEDEGFIPYIDKLVFDGDLNFKSLYESVSQKGSKAVWKDEIERVRKYSVPAKIVIAAAIASVLVPVCNAQVFFTHLWSSTSGTGKTVALMCAASIWGDPDLGRYIQTFNSTQVGQERYAAFLNHLPLMIDELQLNSNQKFSVYQLSEGVGRTRGSRNGGVEKTPTWSNAIITTGETPLIKQSDGAGAFNRTIDIECVAGHKVIEDGQHTTTIIKSNYGFGGREFVGMLFSGQAMIELVRSEFQTVYKKLCQNDTTEKQAMAAALILTADKFFCQWILSSTDYLSIEDMTKYLATKSEVSVGERGYSFFCDWVASNNRKFITPELSPESGEIYGIIEDEKYYYIIRNVFNSVAESKGFNPQSLLSYFREKNLILTRGNHLTRGKRINGIRSECVALMQPTQNDDDEIVDIDEDFL